MFLLTVLSALARLFPALEGLVDVLRTLTSWSATANLIDRLIRVMFRMVLKFHVQRLLPSRSTSPRLVRTVGFVVARAVYQTDWGLSGRFDDLAKPRRA